MINNLITPHTDMKLLAAMINKAATFFSADREDGRIYYEEDGQLFIMTYASDTPSFRKGRRSIILKACQQLAL